MSVRTIDPDKGMLWPRGYDTDVHCVQEGAGFDKSGKYLGMVDNEYKVVKKTRKRKVNDISSDGSGASA